MSSRFNPKYLVLAGGLLAATAVRAADAPAATGTKPPTAASAANEVATSGVTFLQGMQDPYSRAYWMVIQVDFDAAAAKGSARYINDVSVTLMLAWEKTGVTPPVDLVLTSTVKLVGATCGKRNTVFFFVPPETLGRSTTGAPYDANHQPGYYVVQYKVGENTLPLLRADYSSKFASPELANSFVNNVASSTPNKGLLFSEATAPAYLLSTVLQSKLGSNAFPAFMAPGG